MKKEKKTNTNFYTYRHVSNYGKQNDDLGTARGKFHLFVILAEQGKKRKE